MDQSITRPLLSIVVPVYNGSAYIDELFAQFTAQAADGIELVFVDDGSADDSFTKLLQWKGKVDFPVFVHHQENQGVSAARNRGVEIANGEYLCFVDVDDAVSSDYIATLLTYARQGIDVLVFDSKRLHAGEAEPAHSETAQCQKLTSQEMLTKFWADPTCFGVYNLLLRRDYLIEHAISFPLGYKYYEDYDYLLQLFAQTDSLLRLDQVLYYYVLREGSAMNRFNADRIRCLELMKYREGWLEEHAPQFAPIFRQWGTSRLYWSVLWQAALALPSYGDFARFSDITHARKYLVKLKGHQDKLLRLSTFVFLHCRPAYYAAVRLTGRAKSKVAPVSLGEILAQLPESVDFY